MVTDDQGRGKEKKKAKQVIRNTQMSAKPIKIKAAKSSARIIEPSLAESGNGIQWNGVRRLIPN